MIYFDNAASTKPYDEVIEFYSRFLSENYANPSALHDYGYEASKALDYAKEQILSLMNIKDDRTVIFTSGATESANLAIKGTLEKYDSLERSQIITTTIEHACVSEVYRYYANKVVKAVFVPVNELGIIDEEKLLNSITDQTRLVSLIWVNNEVGTVNDIASLAAKIKAVKKDIIIHVDAVQGFGKITADFSNIDMITISSHKFHAPKGAGALICKKNISPTPQILGGGQQNNLRSGTINAPLIAAMGKACEINKKGDNAQMIEVQKYIYDSLSEIYGDGSLNTKLDSGCFAPHIISFSIEGIKSEVLIHMLESKKIYVSASSACSAHKKNNSVLSAYGLNKARAEGTIRISLSRMSTLDEASVFIDELKQATDILVNLKGRK